MLIRLYPQKAWQDYAKLQARTCRKNYILWGIIDMRQAHRAPWNLAAIALGIDLCLMPLAYAQARFRFDLPAQPLAAALKEIAVQSGVNIYFDPPAVKGLRAPGIQGLLSPQGVLTRLLVGTHLRAVRVDEHTFRVVAIGTLQDPPRAPAPARSSVPRRDGRASNAYGEDPATTTAENANHPQVSLQEIVVTAEKVREPEVDVPISMTILSANTLSSVGATQFRDFANMIPGLTFTTAGAGFDQVSLRGITTGLDVSSTVGIYIDNVPVGSSSAFARGGRFIPDGGLFDIQRIEVLRGPQGTLYGASTMGGLIKYAFTPPDTKRLSAKLQSGASTTHEGDTGYNFAAAVNVPLVRNELAVRLSAYDTHDGGYIDNLTLNQRNVNRADLSGGRADLLYTPNRRLTIRLTGLIQDISRHGAGTTDFTPGLSGVPLDTLLTQRRAIAEPYKQHFRLVSATVAYDFPPFTLTSISSYQSFKSRVVYDLSPLLIGPFAKFGPFGGVAQLETPSTDKYTEELRLASTQSTPLQWLVGGFFTHESSDRGLVYLTLNPMGQPVPNDLLDLSGPSIYQEYAAFGNLTWHITRSIDVTGGLRYARDHQEYTQTATGLLGRSAPTARETNAVVTYLADARYHFSPRSMAYLRYATGYRPGGPNLVLINPSTGLPTTSPTFRPDKLNSYEIGYKGESESQIFSLAADTYYIDWKDMQVFDLTSPFGGLTNAGGAAVRGVELSLAAHPVAPLIITGAFAYQDARMTENSPSLGAINGDRLPNVPRFTANVRADYSIDRLTCMPTFGTTLTYVADRRTAYTDTAASRQHVLPEYTTVDLHASATFGGVQALAYVNNVFDERAQISAFVFAGRPQPAISQPRTVGLTLTMEF